MDKSRRISSIATLVMNELLPSLRPRHSIRSMLLAAVLVGGAVLVVAPSLRALEPATVTGDLLIGAKGEVEVYNNGRKLVLRGEAGNFVLTPEMLKTPIPVHPGERL